MTRDDALAAPQVWAMLCVVCVEMEKMDEADMALKQALKFGLTTQETWPIGYSKLLVEQVAALYYKQGLYSGAASILIRGLETSRAPSLNQRLGEVYIADNELSLAADALAEVHPIPPPPRSRPFLFRVDTHTVLCHESCVRGSACRRVSVLCSGLGLGLGI